MCGIAGISVAADDTTINTRVVAAELLRGIESRGRQATGAAWLAKDGNTVDLTKVAVTAKTFLQHREEHLPETTPVMILHTRTGTHGSGANRDNLHPVVHERIVGVHNGVLRNHGKLFTAAKRVPTAEVDSEGIMAILNIEEHPTKVLGQLEGDAAVAWIDLEQPEVLHLACVTGRPLCIGQTKQGSLIFASTTKAVRDAAAAGGLELVFEEEVKEETYLRVVKGIIMESLTIEGVTHSSAAFRQKYAYTSGPGAATSRPKAAQSKPKQITASKPASKAPASGNSRYEADLAAARAADARRVEFSASK
ncbi:glutamine amidotransferase domain protein [Arthrobacter phage Ottawa]|nr:glutamine amidotransferase domain protein [Arthrobacter phage Kharcho]WIC89298.1 glutamine amidotransferase domain protein [Arthrobacter phage Ottawa]